MEASYVSLTLLFALNLTRHIEAAAAPTKVSHMYYQNFNTYVDYRQIRDHHRELATADSHSKLTVLSLAWELNATCFRKLTDSEFNEWSNQRFQAAMDQAKVERDARMAVDGEGQENRIEGSDNEPPLDSTDHQPVSTSLPRQQQTSAHSVNVVTMANGIGVTYQRKLASCAVIKVRSAVLERKSAQVNQRPILLCRKGLNSLVCPHHLVLCSASL
jgi:hypothetical protein